MGSSTWTACAFKSYSHSKGRSVDYAGEVTTSYASASQAYVCRSLNPALDPKIAKNMMRECCDSEEHPNSFPVILGLDVTGSMGNTAIEVSKKLNTLIQGIFKKVKDVEFMVMGIGDIYCDHGPIQYSQFESDIRIAENLDKIWFEAGGGGNAWESYTSAWYIGARRTKCDCWKRGKKGLIITMGDEPLNPYLNARELGVAIGENLQADINTRDLFEEVSEKYDVYHIVVSHGYGGRESYFESCRSSFAQVIGHDRVQIATVDTIIKAITEIVIQNASKNCDCQSSFVETDGDENAPAEGGKYVPSEDGTPGEVSWA